MHVYFDLGFISVPSYGCMIALGVVCANVIAFFLVRKYEMDINDFILTEAYCFLGGFIGAKGLYLLVSYKQIEWIKMLDPNYFNNMMLGGFVFYGGLLGGLLFALIAGKIHGINTRRYIGEFIFLVPFIHAFGRIGCFLAGCCYGIPYSGFGAVIFPDNSYAISGIKLFPVQIVEAFFLMVIFLIVFLLKINGRCKQIVELYFILYGILRFLLEYLRYDFERGSFLFLSTSQWISLILVIIAICMLFSKKKEINNE